MIEMQIVCSMGQLLEATKIAHTLKNSVVLVDHFTPGAFLYVFEKGKSPKGIDFDAIKMREKNPPTIDTIKVCVLVHKLYASHYVLEKEAPSYLVVRPNDAQTYLDDPEWLLVDGLATLQVQRPTLEELETKE